MKFGEHLGGGIAFYLNGELAGWICTTVNSRFSFTLVGRNIDRNEFLTMQQAELALMATFGE